jgi:hypothetical protein
VISNNNLNMNDSLNREKFIGLYTQWAENVFSNLKEISAYVVKADWFPKEKPQ